MVFVYLFIFFFEKILLVSLHCMYINVSPNIEIFSNVLDFTGTYIYRYLMVHENGFFTYNISSPIHYRIHAIMKISIFTDIGVSFYSSKKKSLDHYTGQPFGEVFFDNLKIYYCYSFYLYIILYQILIFVYILYKYKNKHSDGYWLNQYITV